MRRLTIILFILSVACCTMSCNTTTIKYKRLLGQWVLEAKDGVPVHTEEIRVISIYGGRIMNMANTYVGPDGREIWRDNSEMYYSVLANRFRGKGTDALRRFWKFELITRELTYETWSFQIANLIVDNTYLDDQSNYRYRKVVDLGYKDSLQGVWMCVESNGLPVNDRINEYYGNGLFSFYYLDPETGEWVLKRDNNGRYFVYGDLIVTSFQNSINETEKGETFSAFEVSFERQDGETIMHWRSKRVGESDYHTILKRVPRPV